MIADWRAKGGQPDMPFVFVQLHADLREFSEIRLAQRAALAARRWTMSA